MARLRRRWPPASARWPVTGAISAISSPAAALEMPSQVFAVSPPGSASPTTPRTTYGPNTKEVTTAFHDAEPQSHKLHASTTRRLTGVFTSGLLAQSPQYHRSWLMRTSFKTSIRSVKIPSTPSSISLSMVAESSTVQI